METKPNTNTVASEQTTQNNTSEDKKKQPNTQQEKKKHRKVEHCKIDHTNDTIMITKDFAKKANDPTSAEFKYLADLRRTFPNYKVIARTASPSNKRASMKGLTEGFMEQHIRLLHESDMEEYKQQKTISEAFKCPHMYMRKWFDKKYPNWREYVIQKSA